MDAPSANNGQVIFPRILVFDRTAMGDGSATGELKANLFTEWPAENYLQVYHVDAGRLGVIGRGALSGEISLDDIALIVRDYEPELILYRPVPDTPELHQMAMNIIRRSGVPLVTWIMDDWSSSLQIHSPKEWKILDVDLRWLLQNSAASLSICDAMSVALKDRYGVSFTAIANGVDPARWSLPAIRDSRPIKLRYAGSLAENMTLGTLILIARSVEKLAQSGIDITFEIKSHPWWHGLAAKHFEPFSHTSIVVAVLSPEEYVEWLSTADILVIAYNFDPASRTYVKYSMANKLPECLASGVPLLAVGPKDIATMQYLEEIDCGVRVREKDSDLIQAAVRKLVDSPTYRVDLATQAQQVAFKSHNIYGIRDKLTKLLREAATMEGVPPEFSALDKANIDETAAIARIASNRRGNEHVMVDVGAHVGSSASPFVDLGWRVICFEPDPVNRSELVDRFGKSTQVSIDARAVGEKAESERAFYSSAESTGISGMLKFRDSHQEVARVAVTTVGEAIRKYKLSGIDFLKIDVEGYDFAVLKGVPWDSVKPDIIECEYEDAKTTLLGHRWTEIAEYLRTKGYTVYVSEWHPIIKYGVSHSWRRLVRYPGTDVSPKSWGNILAFRSDPGYSALSNAFQQVLFRPTSKTPYENKEKTSIANTDMGKQTSVIPWAREKLRHHWRHSPIALLVIFAVAIAASALAFETVEPIRRELLIGAFLVAVVGLCGVLVRNGFRRKLVKLEQRLTGIYETQLKNRNEKLAKIEAKLMNQQGAQIKDLRERLLHQHDTQITGLEERLISQHGAQITDLQDRLLRQHGTQIKDLKERLLNQHDAQISELRECLLKQHDEQIKVLADKIAKLEASLSSMKSQVGVLDLVAALRALGSLKSGQSATATLLDQPEIEHGHGLLMAVLADEERAHPGSLAGASLIEIGTTRERMAGQGSTEKLAIFTALIGMRFITVDMDAQNTKRAEGTLRYLNPAAKAVTARGENYLKLEEGPFDFIYLDAFDYDHGKHSQQRQDRYRELLQTNINDEACWKMHEACAQAINVKMRVGGIVVLDDTWTDADGQYAGKGKLALPLLLENGFEIIAKTRMTIALRRKTAGRNTSGTVEQKGAADPVETQSANAGV